VSVEETQAHLCITAKTPWTTAHIEWTFLAGRVRVLAAFGFSITVGNTLASAVSIFESTLRFRGGNEVSENRHGYFGRYGYRV